MTWLHVSPKVLRAVRDQYRLDWDGIHGAEHWRRVRDIGRILADRTGADPKVLEYFAMLHDACRWHDGHDKDHGERAADFATGIRELIEVDDGPFESLLRAMRLHTRGETKASLDVMACWDSDRLDLYRPGVSIVPNARYLCTDAAKDRELIRWAMQASRGVQEPVPMPTPD
jgi:uncharacterized protein